MGPDPMYGIQIRPARGGSWPGTGTRHLEAGRCTAGHRRPHPRQQQQQRWMLQQQQQQQQRLLRDAPYRAAPPSAVYSGGEPAACHRPSPTPPPSRAAASWPPLECPPSGEDGQGGPLRGIPQCRHRRGPDYRLSLHLRRCSAAHGAARPSELRACCALCPAPSRPLLDSLGPPAGSRPLVPGPPHDGLPLWAFSSSSAPAEAAAEYPPSASEAGLAQLLRLRSLPPGREAASACGCTAVGCFLSCLLDRRLLCIAPEGSQKTYSSCRWLLEVTTLSATL